MGLQTLTQPSPRVVSCLLIIGNYFHQLAFGEGLGGQQSGMNEDEVGVLGTLGELEPIRFKRGQICYLMATHMGLINSAATGDCMALNWLMPLLAVNNPRNY